MRVRTQREVDTERFLLISGCVRKVTNLGVTREKGQLGAERRALKGPHDEAILMDEPHSSGM